MKNFEMLIWLGFGLADLSLLVGIIAKISGFVLFGLGPYSYFSFAGLCLLYVVALSLAQIALHMRKQYLAHKE